MKTKLTSIDIDKMDTTEIRVLLDEAKIKFPRGLRIDGLREFAKENLKPLTESKDNSSKK